MPPLNKTKVKQFSINTLYNSKSRSSFCWQYFGHLVVEEDNKKKKVLNDQVFCNACLFGAQEENDSITFGMAKIKSYAKTVSTGNLNRHLRDVHDIREETSSHAISNIEQLFAIIPSTGKDSSNPLILKTRDSGLLAKDLALWFCKSLLPFDSMSDKAMNYFFQKYDIIASKEDMPSKDTVCRVALNDIYTDMLENVKSQINAESGGHAAITLDLWSDMYRHLNYVTFSLHYLTDDFELKSFTLCTRLIEGKITSEKIPEMLNDIKDCFDLHGKVLHSVTDSGSNLNRAISLAALDSHSCLGHGLHKLVTIDGISSIPEIKDFIKKCKHVVKTISYNLPELEQTAKKEQLEYLDSLIHVSEQIEMDENEPIVDNDEFEQTIHVKFESLSEVPTGNPSSPTRWHIMLAMLESLSSFCARNTVNSMMAQVGRNDLKIYQKEWNLLENLIRFLRKFREVVEMLSTQKTASLNLALVFHLEIKDILNALSDEETEIMLSLKNKMLEKFDKRFPITDKIVVAALLDTRFISLSQIDSYLEQKNTTRAAFLAEYLKKQTDISRASRPVAPAVTASSSKESVLAKLSRKHSSGTCTSILTTEFNEADEECWKYLATAKSTEVIEDDILQYWREKRTTFPLLGGLARAMLAIPATSIPSDRIFSVEGLIATAKRSRLSPIHVNKIVFIHDNYT